MMLILLQASPSVDPRAAIREHFLRQSENPHTWIGVILVVAALLMLAVILHFVLYYEKRRASPPLKRSPQKLFTELLREIAFSRPQCELLRRISRDLRLQFPTQMLLSPALFSQTAQRWLAPSKTRQIKYNAELSSIAAVLFPEQSSSTAECVARTPTPSG